VRRITDAGAIALLVSAAVIAALTGSSTNEFLDLGVYRAAVDDWWNGRSPYSTTYDGGLSFNYPPSALVLLIPLDVLPRAATGILLVAIGAGITVGVMRSVLTGALRRWALVLAAIVAISEPFQSTWAYGQVNVVLLGAVMLGLTATGVRSGGAALGSSAGLKISPIAFLLIDAVRGRWRVVGVAITTVGGLILLASLRTPPVLMDWLEQTRSGLVVVRPVDRGRSESWSGLLTALRPGTSSTGAWMIISALIITVAVVVAVRATRSHDVVGAAAAVAVAILLVSPVSWTHHWVWTPVFLATAAPLWGATGVVARLHVGVTAALVLATVLWLPTWYATSDRQLDATGWHWLVTYSYVLLGTAFLFTLAAVALRRAPAPDRSVDAES
jgi:alpha-1,2-mannosyltransferase